MYRLKRLYSSKNIYNSIKDTITHQGEQHSFYSLQKLNDPRINQLPYSIRILLENSLRNNDNFVFKDKTTENILNWKNTSK